MAEQDTIPRLSRLSAILTLLQSKRIITASELAEKFNISTRTAYRDIKALELAGIPIFTEEGKGYSLVEGYSLPPIMFTEKEENALITAGELISKNRDKSLVDNHNNAISKIRSVLRFQNKDKAEILSERVFYFNNFNKEITSNNLSTIQVAITDLELVKIKYRSISKDEITQRIIEPQAIYHTSENWIMIAWCRLRNNYREFRLDKIQFLEILNKKFKSRDFNLREYFGEILKKTNTPLT